MAIVLTNAQKEIIRKIIYAVETGGQVYGKMNYDDFTEAYTNSSNEHAITIGAGAWYATEAKNLLKLIRSTDTTTFKKLDTEKISIDLDTKDWSVYKLSKTSKKAKCIQKIISSDIGKKCQDKLIDKQMQKYVNEAADLGVTDIDALMMCSNFRHQGGLSAVKRIIAKTKKPYTLDNLYSACSTDTGNQVGAYKTRQKMVYNSLKKYVPATLFSGGAIMTMTQAIEKVIATAKAEVGYLEKKSNSNLDSKTANSGYNNYTKYWRDIANWGLGNYQAQYWCAAFIFWCFVKTFGKDKAKKLLLHAPYISCYTAGNLFKNAGRLYADPKVGDVVLFKKSDGVFGHTGIVYKVANGYFYTIEGNTSSSSGVVANGGAVAYKSYSISGAKNSGHKFARPDYSLVGSVDKVNSTTTTTTTSASTSTTLNKTAKWTGIVTADELNVRSDAGTNNKTCSFSPLKKNTVVSVCDSKKASDGSVWYYILYNKKYGFVHSKYIKKKEDTKTSTTKTETKTKKSVTATGTITEKIDKKIAGTYKTTADLHMRDDAGTNKKSLVLIPKGTKVTNYGYYKTSGGVKWYYIQVTINNIVYTGFSSSKYLKKV